MNLKSILFGTTETGGVKYGMAADTKDWLPLTEIRNGIIRLKDGRFIKLLEITPINFYLKSLREQEQIIQSFAAYLKIAPDNLQIRVLCQKADLDASMNRLWERYDTEEETACRDMIEKGVYLLGALAQNQTLRRRFFLVFQHIGRDWVSADAALEKVALEAAGMLEECGLESTLLGDEESFAVFEQILNKHAERFLRLDDTRDGGMEILAPQQVDTTNRRYIIVDGVYHATLYITSYGYPTQVFAGWLGFLAEAGEGIGLSFFLNRQRKDKVLSQIAQKTMWSRSRMRDIGDTRQDYEQLESAIFSGLYLKDGINRGGQDFYYMHTLIEVSADSPESLERRIESVKNLCTANNYTVKRADYRNEQGFLSCLPTLSPDPALMRKSRRNILTDSAAASFPFCSFELYDPEGICKGRKTCFKRSGGKRKNCLRIIPGRSRNNR